MGQTLKSRRLTASQAAATAVAVAGVLIGAGFLAAQQPGTLLPNKGLPGLPEPSKQAPVQPGTVLPGAQQETQTGPTNSEPGAPIEFDESAAADGLTPDFRQQVTNILIPVIVTDRDGNFVNNLTPLDFQLLDNGTPRRFTEDVASRPVSLVVAVQADATSGQFLPTVQKVAPLFDSLVIGETGEMALIGFDHRIQDLTGGFTSDPDQIRAGFAKLKPGSRTHRMNDTAMNAVNMLRNRGKDRKRILLLISETRDRGSEFSPRDVLTNAEFNDVVIYSVNMNHLLNQLTSRAEPNRPNPVPPEAQQLPGNAVATGTYNAQTNVGNYAPIFKEIFELVKGIFIPNPLEVYTTFTGGREHNFVTLSGLEEAITDIGGEIHSQYLLTFSAGSDVEGGYHEIEVRVLKPELEVRSRPGYWIAPQSPDQPKQQ